MNIKKFSTDIVYGAQGKPDWAHAVSRWHQLDGASYALVSAYVEWKDKLQKPALIILASSGASNDADFDFVASGAQSPSKMIHTLPSARASPLCQVMGWSGPILCLQNDPSTFAAGMEEGKNLVSREYPVVWVVGVTASTAEGQNHRVELSEMTLS